MMIYNRHIMMSPSMMQAMHSRMMFSAVAVERPQLRINKNPITSEVAILEQSLPKKEHPECFFPQVYKAAQTPNPTFIARKFNIPYSVYKLNSGAMIVRKRYLLDALQLITNEKKKGGKLIKSVLEACRVNGMRKGYAEDRMWVKEVVLGKAVGAKKVDIKARGKMGFIHAPISSITVICEERSQADLFKMIVKGNTPPTIGHTFRKMLYQNDADFEKVKALSHMTTSRGRYYRKVQFRRLIQLI